MRSHSTLALVALAISSAACIAGCALEADLEESATAPEPGSIEEASAALEEDTADVDKSSSIDESVEDPESLVLAPPDVQEVPAEDQEPLEASFEGLDESLAASGSYPRGMNKAEWNFCRWPSRFRICNKAAGHAKEAGARAKQLYSAASLHNGKGDAFRHCYWNARMTINMGSPTARGFADRHEQTPGQPAIEKTMDLRNNNIGRTVGQSYHSYAAASNECQRRANQNRLWIIVNGRLV